jgi:caspase domain-containing protein
MYTSVRALCASLLAVAPLGTAQSWTPPAPPEPRYAIVIGNADYQDTSLWPKLPSAILDQAMQMASTLRVLGFSAYGGGPLLNQNIGAMRQALKGFIDEVPSGALVWVFYSGHGVEGLLVPVDAATGDSMGSCCIVLKTDILDRLEARHAKAAVVVVNACRSSADAVPGASNYPMPEPGRNEYLAFSTRSGELAHATSTYVPDLLAAMSRQGAAGQVWNVEAIFSTVNDDARNGDPPADPVTFGTVPPYTYLIPPDSPIQYIDFHEAVNAGPDFIAQPGQQDVPAAPYLAKYGITIDNVTSGTHIGLMKPGVVYSGFSENGAAIILHQDGDTCNQVESVSYTLHFSPPLKQFAFSRVRLLAESRNGITHPSWEAHAFDPNGREIPQDKPVGEDLIRYIPPFPAEKGAVPENTFTMHGPYIASVTFTSSNRLDGRPFAAFCSIQISSMGLVRGPAVSMGPDGRSLASVAW